MIMKYNVCLNIVTSAITQVEAENDTEAQKIACDKIRQYLGISNVAVFACDEYTKIDVYDYYDIDDDE